MESVLFDGLVDGPGAPAVALYDPHAPRELRAGLHPVEAFRLLRAHDRGALALVRWHAQRVLRVAVTTTPPPPAVRAEWRHLEDHWIEVGPSGTVVIDTIDRFSDPERDDDTGEVPAVEHTVALRPGRYRVARFDRRELVRPIDEGYETLHPGETDVKEAGPQSQKDSRVVAVCFVLTSLEFNEAPPALEMGAVRAWRQAIDRGDFDPTTLVERIESAHGDVALLAAALAEMGTPESLAALRRAALSDDSNVAAAIRNVSRAYNLQVNVSPPRRGGTRG